MRIAAFLLVLLAAVHAYGQPLEMQLPKYSTPPSCDAGRTGRVYYDTDDNLVYWCNGTVWTSFGAAFSISGTNPFVARFNSAGNNVEDSVLRAAGLPAAGASGNLTDLTQTLNAMDGSDTVRGLFIDLTNGANTGAANALRGIEIDTITATSGTTEIAMLIGTGWDRAIQTSNSGFIVNQTPAAATSGQLVLMQPNLTIMDGSDSVTVLSISPTNDNHTGAANSNTLLGISIGGITPDTETKEYALQIGGSAGATPWDRDINFTTEGIAGTHANIFNENTNGNTSFAAADATPQFMFVGNDVELTRLENGQELTNLMGTDLAVVGAAQNVDPNANTVEISAGAAASVLTVTPPTSTNHTEEVTFICVDANVTFTDSGAAGAANTMDLLGVAVGFVCSAEDSITMKFRALPSAGNARWVEVSRSVN